MIRRTEIARAAEQDAREARQRATARLRQAEVGLPAAREETRRLRALNESNGFDQWLIGWLRKEAT